MLFRSGNRAILAQGFCVYVQCPAQVLAARLAADPLPGQRPSLTGQSLDQEIAGILAQREPLYLSCAHLVAPGSESPDRVAAFILDALAHGAARL